MPEPLFPGWLHLGAEPSLIGTQCVACGTYYFPKLGGRCRNPDCDGETFEEVALSRTGTLWSYTNAGYQPPEPYVAAAPYQPFAIAAVELERERMIVLGPVTEGIAPENLAVGQMMELAVESVPDQSGPEGKIVWKWKPLEGQG